MGAERVGQKVDLEAPCSSFFHLGLLLAPSVSTRSHILILDEPLSHLLHRLISSLEKWWKANRFWLRASSEWKASSPIQELSLVLRNQWTLAVTNHVINWPFKVRFRNKKGDFVFLERVLAKVHWCYFWPLKMESVKSTVSTGLGLVCSIDVAWLPCSFLSVYSGSVSTWAV